MAVSNRPSDARPTGFLDGITVEISNARFVEWDYDGRMEKKTLFAQLTFVGPEVPKGEHIQYYSAGDLKFFEPSADGRTLVSKGTREDLTDGCNFISFMAQLVNSGFPEDQLGEDISKIEGTCGTLVQIPQPTRDGIAVSEGQRVRTILVFDNIEKLPWKKGKAGVAKKKGPSPKTDEIGLNTDPMDEVDSQAKEGEVKIQAQSLILELLSNAGDDGIKKSMLRSEIFKAAANINDLAGVRTDIVKLAGDMDFLSTGPWSLENEVLRLG